MLCLLLKQYPKMQKGANIGFDIDFGSDLKMKEALNVSNSISRIAEH